MSRAGTRARPRARGGARGLEALRDAWGRVPARIMEPRLVLVAAVAALVAIGLVMVFSASSIKGLLEGEDPSSYLKKQVFGVVAGCVVCVAAAKVDYHVWGRRWLPALWVLSVVLLVAVHLHGTDSHGATRWITLGPLSFQPSEFAKICVVVTSALVINDYVCDGRPATLEAFARDAAWKVGVPLALILFQPDKGTTLVLGLTVFCLALMAGIPRRPLLVLAGVCVAGYLALSLKDDYSRQRFLTMFNPFADADDSGYQLVQGFYAFASGGLFGCGVGMGRQKYSYLPEAHNDFIFAVIGEELGLVGCLVVLALFGLILWAGFRIAREAPDFFGTLLASGSTLLLVFTVLLNVSGVIGIFPLSGKAVPFLSYGGTSMMSSLLVVGTILSVSVQSRLPETDHDRRRSRLGVVPADRRPDGSVEGSAAGQARPRSLRLVDGGTAAAPRQAQEGPAATDRGRPGTTSRGTGGRPEVRRTRDANGRERIELGPSAQERLRPDTGPKVREPSRDARPATARKRRRR